MLSFFVSCCCCKIEIIKKPRGGICMRKPRHGNVWETRSASPKPMAALPPRQPSGRKTHTRDIPKQQPSLARALSFIFFFFLSFFLFPLPFSHLGFFFFLFFWGKYIWRVLFLFFFFLPCYLITLPHFSMNLHIFNQNWIFFFFVIVLLLFVRGENGGGGGGAGFGFSGRCETKAGAVLPFHMAKMFLMRPLSPLMASATSP